MTFSRRGLFAFFAGLFAAKRAKASIVVLSPDKSPLLSLIAQLKRKAGPAPSFEWHEEDYRSRWGQLAKDASQDADILVATDGLAYCPGDIVQVWHGQSEYEMFRVLSIHGNELIVVRGAGATKAGNLVAGSALQIVGSVNA